ncbi:hypothetical protein ACFS07_07900 [Undibacterium arcticum]
MQRSLTVDCYANIPEISGRRLYFFLIEILLCGWPAGAAARTQTQTQELPGVVAAAFKRAGIPPSAVGSFCAGSGQCGPGGCG